MTRVATASSYSAVLADIMRAQGQQNQANAQVSSGKIATDLKGYGEKAQTLVAAKSVKTRVDAFVEQNKTLSAKLDAQDLALNRIGDAVTAAKQAITEALATGDATTFMDQLKIQFGEVVSGLNTQHDGRYLFAGGQVNTPPTTAQGLTDLTAAASTSDLFKNDNLATTSRLDESTTVTSGFLADDVGTDVFNAFKAIQAFAQSAGGPFNGKLTDAQTTFLQGQLAVFESARQGVVNVTAQNGLIQNRVDTAQQNQSDRSSALEAMIGGVTDVDMASAVSKLQLAQTAFQASAQVFATLNNNSLLNFLK